MFYVFCTLLYVHSSIAIILMGKRELVALLNLSSWCLVMVQRLLLAVPRGCLWFVIVVFPDHTHLLFLSIQVGAKSNKNVVQQKGQRITYILTRPCMIFLGFSEVKNAFLSLHAR